MNVDYYLYASDEDAPAPHERQRIPIADLIVAAVLDEPAERRPTTNYSPPDWSPSQHCRMEAA